MRALLVVLVLAGGCGSFEDPAIVIDLRPLAMVADPPEQLIPFDPNHPPDPSSIHLVPIQICAHVADPGAHRKLDFTMTACPPATGERCDPDDPSVLVGGGTIDDPEDAPTPQPACAQLDPSADLVAVVRQTVQDDPLQGFAQVDIQVVMSVGPQGGAPSEAVWASKRVRFGAQLPADRTPNHNPTLSAIQWELASAPAPEPHVLSFGRCIDGPPAIELAAGDTVHLTPVEPAGAREAYVVPTFDGSERAFVENLGYDWMAGAGSWEKDATGGAKDPVGNDPPLDTHWHAPRAKDVGPGGLDVPLYIVQRDERGGQAWYQTCVHVHP
jgi:hypothetical protein